MAPIDRKFIHNLLETHGSKCFEDSGITHTHVAFILQNGKPIASATNRTGSRSNGCGYANYTIHAERAVIKKLGDKDRLAGAILIVVRLKRVEGGFKLYYSEPCSDCKLQLQKHMAEDGLKRVYYS